MTEELPAIEATDTVFIILSPYPLPGPPLDSNPPAQSLSQPAREEFSESVKILKAGFEGVHERCK